VQPATTIDSSCWPCVGSQRHWSGEGGERGVEAVCEGDGGEGEGEASGYEEGAEGGEEGERDGHVRVLECIHTYIHTYLGCGGRARVGLPFHGSVEEMRWPSIRSKSKLCEP